MPNDGFVVKTTSLMPKPSLSYLGMQADALVVCHDDNEMNLKLLENPMVGGAKLNLVSMDQMKIKK